MIFINIFRLDFAVKGKTKKVKMCSKNDKSCGNLVKNCKMQPIVDKIQTRIGRATEHKFNKIISEKARYRYEH